MHHTPAPDAPMQPTASWPAKRRITLTVNGAAKPFDVAPWTTRLDARRESLALTGTNKRCAHGPCGACTVLVDGRRILACLTLALMQDGAAVTTVAGLGEGMEHVTFNRGDSSLSKAPVEGGSCTASTVGSAVKAVCQEVGGPLFPLARTIDDSPLADAERAAGTCTGGHIRLHRDASRAVALTEVLRQGPRDTLEAATSAGPSPTRAHDSSSSHAAVFAAVNVDQDLGTIQVTRVVSAVAGGRILNPKTARSQVLGGIVWGIGMALEEESVIDHTFGRFVNHNLAEYHVPVNADVHDIEVIFVEEHDEVVNPLGAKGLGEPGVVGVAAAVANAVFHATGTRVRDLPITLDKLL